MLWHPRSKEAENATADVELKIFRTSTSFQLAPFYFSSIFLSEG